MGHHQKTDRVHAEFTGGFNMLPGDLGFGAVGGDAELRAPA